ncbi:exported hypothetical protein [Plantibacter sp. T3]|nr:exported hypothetical protein [Plantibacter sp. T3]
MLPPCSKSRRPSGAKSRSPGRSPSRQAPLEGGFARRAPTSASVTKREGTLSSGVCQSIGLHCGVPWGVDRPCYVTRSVEVGAVRWRECTPVGSGAPERARVTGNGPERRGTGPSAQRTTRARVSGDPRSRLWGALASAHRAGATQ